MNAMNAGIPVLSYNARRTRSNGEAVIGSNRLAYVGQALYISGQQMGEQIKSLVPGGGDIAIFIATPGSGNIQPRYDGAAAVLKAKGGYNGRRDRHRRATGQEQSARRRTCSATSPSRARSRWTRARPSSSAAG